MKILLTKSLNTKYNKFKRYCIEDGLYLWYIHTNKGEITSIRERLWDATKDDIIYEKPINTLPDNVMNEFNIFTSKNCQL